MLFRLSPAGIARCAFLLCIEDIAAKACVDRGLHLGRQGACGLPQFAASGFDGCAEHGQRPAVGAMTRKAGAGRFGMMDEWAAKVSVGHPKAKALASGTGKS